MSDRSLSSIFRDGVTVFLLTTLEFRQALRVSLSRPARASLMVCSVVAMLEEDIRTGAGVKQRTRAVRRFGQGFRLKRRIVAGGKVPDTMEHAGFAIGHWRSCPASRGCGFRRSRDAWKTGYDRF